MENLIFLISKDGSCSKLSDIGRVVQKTLCSFFLNFLLNVTDIFPLIEWFVS